MSALATVAGFALLALAALVLVAVIAWDLYAVRSGRTTVSRWVLRTSARYPLVAAGLGFLLGWAAGVLTGHLWFPQELP